MSNSLIFTFGNVAVGKSTLLAAICKDFQDNPNFHLVNNFDTLDELRILNLQWIGQLEDLQFPPKSNPNQTYVIDLGIVPERNGDNFSWSFFEMSGEHFKSLNLDYDKGSGKLRDDLLKYIEDSHLCIIVTDVDGAALDDTFIDFFIQNLVNEGIVDIPIALVISKWDKLSRNRNTESFVEKNLPKTLKWFNSKKFFTSKRIFTFSVGKVKNPEEVNKAEDSRIEKLDINLSGLPKWLYQQLKDN